ncbi:3280_t:CDS:2, partial [Scutellospora calospora]
MSTKRIVEMIFDIAQSINYTINEEKYVPLSTVDSKRSSRTSDETKKSYTIIEIELAMKELDGGTIGIWIRVTFFFVGLELDDEDLDRGLSVLKHELELDNGDLVREHKLELDELDEDDLNR